jgi:hypothetical protein
LVYFVQVFMGASYRKLSVALCVFRAPLHCCLLSSISGLDDSVESIKVPSAVMLQESAAAHTSLDGLPR